MENKLINRDGKNSQRLKWSAIWGEWGWRDDIACWDTFSHNVTLQIVTDWYCK